MSVRQTFKEFRHGHKLVGTVPVRLIEANMDLSAYQGVVLRCPGPLDPNGGNTHCIWIGGSGVTANSSEFTGGMPIAPGENFTIPAEKLSELWVVSSGANQDIAWFAM